MRSWPVAAIALLLPAVACVGEARFSTILPPDQGDLAVVALVESDPAGSYPVIDHTQLLPVAGGAAELRATVEGTSMLRLVVFLFDSAALAEAIAPGACGADLAERVSVARASAGEGLTRAGRADRVSEAFAAEEGREVDTLDPTSDPVLGAIRDRVEAQLVLVVEPCDAGLDAAADGGPDAAADGGLDSGADGGLDSGADSGLDSGADSGLDSGADSGPPCDLFSTPTHLSGMSTPSSDSDPFVSADGLALYISSDRSGTLGGSDIWVATRPDTASAFGAPSDVTEVNSSDSEYDPALSSDGLSLFLAVSTGAGWGYEISVSTRPSAGVSFGPPAILPGVNSSSDDFAPSISGDGLTLYLHSVRPGGLGNRDIWVATRPDAASAFDTPTNVTEVNSTSGDFDPEISSDGLTLYFDSDRPGGVGDRDIWAATRPDTGSAFGSPANVSEVNTTSVDHDPTISSDGLTLYLSSERPGGEGWPDIWVATRGCL